MIECSKSKGPGRVRATQPNKSANPSWPSTELTRVDTRELANDRPHDTDNILIHRLLHPKNAEPRRKGGAERARAPAMAFTNSTASWLRLLDNHRLRRVTSIANCVPWNSGSPLANTSIDLSSIAETATFMSRSFLLQRTEAPASRHTRAKLRSGPTARVRSRPDLGQAPRCLPSKFKRQPHSQRASVISSGRRNLSITRARKRCGSTTNSGWEGAPHKTSLEPGPECERKCATWPGE